MTQPPPIGPAGPNDHGQWGQPDPEQNQQWGDGAGWDQPAHPSQYGQPAQPAQPGQYGQPAQPGQYGQPAQPGQFAPQAQPGQYGQPAQPGQWQQPAPWDYLGAGQEPAPYGPPADQPRKRRSAAIIAAVAAVVIVGGGAATYVAVSDKGSSSAGGAANPQDAVNSLVTDLNNSDVLGLLDHLSPGERDALVNPIKDTLDTEKRLKILRPDTNLSNLSYAKIKAQNITFGKTAESVNDHVQIVTVTGGTISVNTDLTKVPFTDEFVKAAFPHGLPAQQGGTSSIDLGKIAQQTGQPVQVATQKVGGKWYPSMMYTIAYYASKSAGVGNPTSADYVAPSGAGSPEDAVKQAVDAASKQDFKRLIELASPEELAVLHDYAGLLLKQAPSPNATGALNITNLDLTTAKASGGATRVSLKSVSFSAGGQTGTLAIDGSCVKVSQGAESKTLCAKDAVDQIAKSLGRPITAEQRAAFEHLFAGLPNIGVLTTQVDGKWYLNPVRSYFDLTSTLLSGLQDNDLITLLSLIQR